MGLTCYIFHLKLRDKCFRIEKSVCVGELKSEIGLESNESGLIGEFKFDDAYGMDSSVLQNDIQNPPKVGPQQGGKGYSGFFDQTEGPITTIKHH